MGPSSFVQSHRPSRSTSHSVSYSDGPLYPSLVSIPSLLTSKAFLQLTPILPTSSPSYILLGCHPLVLECLHLPKSLYMARGRYVSPPFLHHPFASLLAPPTPIRIGSPAAQYNRHKAPSRLFPDFAPFQSADITYQSSMLDSWATTTTNRNSEDPTDVPRRKEWDTSAHSQSPSRPDPVRHNFTSPFHTILPGCLKPLPHYRCRTAFY